MITLQNFVRSSGDPDPFPTANTFPTFFLTNLLDPSRVIKAFYNDPQATIRAFYFQYLRLCFELENVDYELYLRKIEEIIRSDSFHFIFSASDDHKVFNDVQLKRLIMQFFTILGEGSQGVEEAIRQYPIMDMILIRFFRSILILAGKTDTLDSFINRRELLQFLSGLLRVEITWHGKCLKFVESDIFLYEDDPSAVYMAFIEDNQNEEQTQAGNQINTVNSHHNLLSKVEIIQSEAIQLNLSEPPSQGSSSLYGSSQINKSYIASEFIDYTSSSLLPTVKKESLKISEQISGSSRFGKIDLSKNMDANKSELKTSQSLRQLPNQTQKQNKNIKLSLLQYIEQPSFKMDMNQGQLRVQSKMKQKIDYYQQGLYIKQQDFRYSQIPTKDIDIGSNNKMDKNKISQKIDVSKKDTFVYEVVQQPSKVVYSKYQQFYHPSLDNKPKSPNLPHKNSIELDQLIKNNQPLPSQLLLTNHFAQIHSSKPNNSCHNVTIQFSNTMIMNMMSKPYGSNVRNIRERARNQRESLKQLMK